MYYSTCKGKINSNRCGWHAQICRREWQSDGKSSAKVPLRQHWSFPYQIHSWRFRSYSKPERRGHKLGTSCPGHYRIVEAKSDRVFVIGNVQQTKPDTVHARRSSNHRAPLGEDEISKMFRDQAEFLITTQQLVDPPMVVNVNNGKYEILVQWKGWPDPGDMTWEPFITLPVDVPRMVKDFLHTPGRPNLKSEILELRD